jgi:hypothetical protein
LDSGRTSGTEFKRIIRYSEKPEPFRKENPDSRAIAQTHKKSFWETSSNQSHISAISIKQTESPEIAKIFMPEDFVILCDDISGFSKPRNLPDIH